MSSIMSMCSAYVLPRSVEDEGYNSGLNSVDYITCYILVFLKYDRQYV